MWSQYDENLSENPFFKELKENQTDIIGKSSAENWIICVPRVGTFESKDVGIDTILDHILVTESQDSYHTLSKKRVFVKNKHISTESSHISDVEILFEEVFYIAKSRKFTVWCIHKPLFVKYNLKLQSSEVLENLHDCIDFLWAESLDHSVLEQIRELVNNFKQQHEEITTETLQTQKELLGKLFSECLQICLKSESLKDKSLKDKIFLEKFKLSVETYMQFYLGTKLMFSINTLQFEKDAVLNKIIRNSCELKSQDLGISSSFSDLISSAKCELNKINNYLTVLGKISCLRRTFNAIFENNRICITSDEVLQILVFLILKLQINNWNSNLMYIKEFRFSTLDDFDQTGYFITSLEAALEFIKSSEFLKLKNNLSNTLVCKQLELHHLYSIIKNNEIKSLKTENNYETNLCHPLCTCENCKCVLKMQEDKIMTLNPKKCNEKGQNLLISATITGNCEVVEFLLEQKFDINYSDCFNRTSLHYAASKGYQNILLLLINRKAHVNASDNDKNTPLHLACQNGHENCVKALLYSSGIVELNVSNFYGDTPLHLATKLGYFEIVKILLESGASAIIKNKRNQLPFNLAPNYYVLKIFQEFGLERSQIIAKKISETAVVQKNDDYSVRGVEHGIQPKDTEQFKKLDLLLKAIENNDLPLSCFYLGFFSKNIDLTEHTKCHPLCLCEKCQTEQEIEIDLPQKSPQLINVNMCNVNGYTPLHIAAKFGRTQILRLLLDSGALPNVQTYKTLYTPLHLAAIFQKNQTVRELLQSRDCKIDESDCKGNTPLYYACLKNDIKIVELLLLNGADCNKKNFAGQSPLHESEENMHYPIFKLLKNSIDNCLEKDVSGGLFG